MDKCNTKEHIKVIRQCIRELCKKNNIPAMSVRAERGTATGWIVISTPKGEYRQFNETENKILNLMELMPGANAELIAPDKTYYKALRAERVLNWLDKIAGR